MHCEVMDTHAVADRQIGILKCHMIRMGTNFLSLKEARLSIRSSFNEICCHCSWRIVKRPPRKHYCPNRHLPPVTEDQPTVTDEMMQDVHTAHVVMEAKLMNCPKTLHDYGGGMSLCLVVLSLQRIVQHLRGGEISTDSKCGLAEGK